MHANALLKLRRIAAVRLPVGQPMGDVAFAFVNNGGFGLPPSPTPRREPRWRPVRPTAPLSDFLLRYAPAIVFVVIVVSLLPYIQRA